MPDMSIVFVVVAFALVFDYINGFHDTANAIATSVSTRALAPSQAILMSAVLNFGGAMFSTGVAKTIGGDIVRSAAVVTQPMIVTALAAAIIWNLVTWWYAIPSSSSHALIGGLMGSILVSVGPSNLNFAGIEKIVLSLVLSPIVALITGYAIMILMLWGFGRFSPSKLNTGFKRMQLISAGLMSFSHGSNDAQKSMGIITLALLSAGYIPALEVPTWVKLVCATAMASGTAIGGWKIIKTMGGRIFKMEPINGFSADLNSATVIFSSTLLNLPVSTTHVVAGSIMGVGSAKRIHAVRWTVARQMLVAWVLTIPLSALTSACIYQLVMIMWP